MDMTLTLLLVAALVILILAWRLHKMTHRAMFYSTVVQQLLDAQQNIDPTGRLYTAQDWWPDPPRQATAEEVKAYQEKNKC